MTDSHWLDDLDAAWDDLVQGRQGSKALDPGARQTLGRLHRLQAAADAPLAMAGRSRSWNAPQRPRRRFRVPTPRFSAVHAYGLVGLLLLVTMAGAYSTTRRDHDVFGGATQLPAAGGPPLYRIDGSNGTWQNINPITLSAIGEPAQIYAPSSAIPTERHWLGLVSADGSTLVEQVVTFGADNSNQLIFRIHDAASRTVRSEIEPGKDVSPAALSSDGHRLVFFHTTASGLQEPTTDAVDQLVVYDTATGKEVNSVNLATDVSDVIGYPVIDATGTRAYVLKLDYSTNDWRLGTVELTTYDVASGAVSSAVAIPGLTSLRNVISGASTKPDHAMSFRPAMNLSSDGRTLAMIGWDGQTLALFDTKSGRLQVKTMLNDHGDPCFTLDAGFSTLGTLNLVGDRMVTTVLASDSGSGLHFLGYCSTDIATGRSVFKAHHEMLPADWIIPAGFLASDAKHFYVTGFQNPSATRNPSGGLLPVTYGIYEFDAVTLMPGSHITYSTQNQDGFPVGLLLSEQPPS